MAAVLGGILACLWLQKYTFMGVGQAIDGPGLKEPPILYSEPGQGTPRPQPQVCWWAHPEQKSAVGQL